MKIAIDGLQNLPSKGSFVTDNSASPAKMLDLGKATSW